MKDLEQQAPDTIDLYLAGKLPENELQEFETRILDDPETWREVQRRESFIEALRESQFHEKSVPSHDSENPATAGFARWIRQPLSVAASLVIAMGTLFMGSSVLTPGQQAPAVVGLNTASSVLVERMRSATAMQTISGDFPMRLQIDIGPDWSAETVTVTLQNASTGSVSRQVLVDNEGWANLVINAPIQGQVTLTASGSGDADAPVEISTLNLLFE